MQSRAFQRIEIPYQIVPFVESDRFLTKNEALVSGTPMDTGDRNKLWDGLAIRHTVNSHLLVALANQAEAFPCDPPESAGARDHDLASRFLSPGQATFAMIFGEKTPTRPATSGGAH
jgi:hypothetical protein